MDDISPQLLLQRLRNRVIEILDLCASLDDIAMFGAFSTINLIDDVLPLDDDQAPGVFSDDETMVIAEFLRLTNAAAGATPQDILDVAALHASKEWIALSRCALAGLTTFLLRGRFSEEREEVLAQ